MILALATFQGWLSKKPPTMRAYSRPGRRRDGRGVHADEPLAILRHEVEQVLLLLRRQVQLAVGVEQHGIEVVQVAHRRLPTARPSHIRRCPTPRPSSRARYRCAGSPHRRRCRDRCARSPAIAWLTHDVGDLVAGGKVRDHQQFLPACVGIAQGRCGPGAARTPPFHPPSRGLSREAAARRRHHHVLPAIGRRGTSSAWHGPLRPAGASTAADRCAHRRRGNGCRPWRR